MPELQRLLKLFSDTHDAQAEHSASQPAGELARGFNLPGWVVAIAGLSFLVVAAIYAFATSFSYFSAYDDEGYLMLSVRGFLEGHALYKEVLTGYGPVYYFYEWFLHGPLGLALNHDVTRVLCILHWLGVSSILALTLFRMSRSLPIAFFGFMQAALHLTPLAREPGHPQEIVAVLLVLSVLVATRHLERKWTLPLLIAIGAAAVFTKINVGVFYGLSLLMALMCQAALFRSQRWLFWVLLALSSFLPFVLMRPQLSQSWAWAYGGQACISILTASAVAYCLHARKKFGVAKLFQAGALFALVSAGFIGVCAAAGSPVAALIDSLIIAPSKLGSLFCIPLKAPYCTWSGAVALVCAVAVIVWRNRLGRARFVVACGKALYGLAGALLLVTDYNAQLGYLLPWAWLLLVPVSSDHSGKLDQTFARTFLALGVAWQSLQAFPVSGTQAVIATILPIFAYSICLDDAIKVFLTAPRIAGSMQALTQRVATLLRALVIAGLFFLFATSWCDPVSAWRYYASTPSLGLPGATHLHLPPAQAQIYQGLTKYLQTQSDTFVTVPGLNSLYFWTGKKPPTYFNISEVVLLNDRQQAEVVSALRNARRPLIVVNKSFWWYSAGNGPLSTLIDGECREICRFGNVQVLELPKHDGGQL